MASLPSSLALAAIADGSNIVAADHRNNYAAVQVAVNALIADLGAGVAGQVLGLTPGAVTPVVPPGTQLDYAQITVSNASITATSTATANTVITGTSQAYDGTAVWVEFFAPKVTEGSSLIAISLYDGATELGVLCRLTSAPNAISGKVRLTPSAATHQYIVKASVDSGTGSITAGAGTIGTDVPAFLRITKA